MQTKNTKQGGFTLVEIAIVLVIIGLLLGGILKGQELINNAKVRSVADRQNSLKASWYSFRDRYSYGPGDSKRAGLQVPGAIARTDDQAGDGFVSVGESPLVMQQLTGAGFLRCPQCTATAPATPDADNSLINQYSGIMSIWHDDNFYAEKIAGTTRSTSTSGRLQIHSGPRIPSNILSEVDRKIDDGVANTGDMVFNFYDPATPAHKGLAIDGHGGDFTLTDNAGDSAPFSEECTNTVDDFAFDAVGTRDSQTETLWRTTDRDPAVENNCGASIFV